MRVNVSRHTGTFADFKWQDDTADFPVTEEVYTYLNQFSEHHNLRQYIHFGCKVNKVSRRDTKWIVSWKKDTQTIEEVFDAVIVASGKFSKPSIPAFEGIENLTVKKLHSIEYRSAQAFANQRVLIVGGSLSGTAIAEEVAKTTHVSHLLRRERWVVKRYRSSDPKNNGPLLPKDLLKSQASYLISLTPEEQYNNMVEHCSEQNVFPEWRMTLDSPRGFVVADEYFNEVRAGNIVPIRGEIDHFMGTYVLLKSGRRIDFDAIIFCTGYENDLSFLDDALQIKVNKSSLYEDIFPEDIDKIAFIGLYPGARAAVLPIVELQAKLACRTFCEQIELPETEKMKAEIAQTPKERNEIKYMNALAHKLGVFPNYDSFNMGVKHMLINGAFSPARFLLTGQHSDKESALKIIEETEIYRRELLHSKDRIPTLYTLCSLKLKSLKN
jgi:dimethylaniline monooxygenase (N-oxide forming)